MRTGSGAAFSLIIMIFERKIETVRFPTEPRNNNNNKVGHIYINIIMVDLVFTALYEAKNALFLTTN